MAGVLVFVLLLVLLFVAVRVRRRAVPLQPKRPNDTEPVRLSASFGGGLSRRLSERSWAPPRELSPGVWRINPDLDFPLTIESVDAAAIERLRRLLDAARDDFYEQRTLLVELFAERNPRWREVEEYAAAFRPSFEKQIKRLQRSSPEWAGASEADREDMLASFRREAIATLDVQPDCDLALLLEGRGVDEALDDVLARIIHA